MTDNQYQNIQQALFSTASARITELQRRMLANESGAVATLARLRRCDPSQVGADPLVWQVTLGDLPDVLTSFGDRRPDAPTPAERALHATLVLYALHQQRSRDEGVHRPGISFGRAVRMLSRARAVGEEPDAGTVGRLHHAVLASDFAGHLHHLRGLIQLMKAEKKAIGIDYGRLAVDLWYLADPYRDSLTVLSRWGRDLHSKPKITESTNEEK